MLSGFIQAFKKLENWGRWMAPAFINSIGGIVNTATTSTHYSHAFITLPVAPMQQYGSSCARHPSLSAADAVKGLRLQLLATGMHDERITCHGHAAAAAHNHFTLSHTTQVYCF